MKRNRFSHFAALLTTSALVSTAIAADLTWIDANANNDWNLTQLNWNPGAIAWTNTGNNAVFGGTAETVILTEPISAGSITFNVADYVISNDTLTLSGGVIANQNATISSIIDGTAISKSGSGVLTLSGPNTFTGALTVNTGTVKLGNAAALGTAAGGTTIVSGATLDMGGIITAAGETVTIAGIGVAGSAMTGGGNLVGNLVLSANATIGGGAADLQLGTKAAPATITGAFTLTKTGTNRAWYRGPAEGAGNSLAAVVIDNGTFGIEANDNALKDVPITVNTGGVFSSWGTGVANTSQNNPVTLNGGAIGADLGGQKYTGPVTLTANSFAGSTASNANFNISGLLSGAFTLEKQAAGTLTLSNANVGVTSINVTGGRLTLDRAIAGGVNLGTTAITLGTGREMVVAISTGVSGGGVTMGAGSLLSIQNGNGGTGGAGFAPNIALNAGTGAANAASIGGFIYGNSTNITSTISGTGDLRWRNGILGGLSNDATLTAANNTSGWAVNSYTGATSFEGTNLTFALASNANNDVINPFGVSANAVTQTAGLIRVLTTGTASNTAIIENPISFIAGDTQTTRFYREDGNLKLTGAINIATSGTGKVVLDSKWGYATTKGLVIEGLVSGSGNLTITRNSGEDGTVHLANNGNTFSGPITLDSTSGGAGLLILDADGAATFASINLAIGGANLNVNATNATIASLAGVAASRVSARTAGQILTVNQTTDTTYAGTLGGSAMTGANNGLALIKSGGGKLTLTGVNVNTGTTTVSGGILALVGGSQTSAISVEGSGALGFDPAAPTTSTAAVTFNTSNKVTIVGTPAVGTLMTAASFTGTPVLSPAIPGYALDTATPGQLKLVATGAGYSTWAATNAPTGGAGGDYDNDGVSSGAEYVLGGLATTQDSNKLPTVDASGTNLVFSFKRIQTSKTADTTVTIDVGTTLAAWTTSYTVGNDNSGLNVGSSAGVTVTNNNDGFDLVTLTVAKTPDPKKFARLNVKIN